MLWTKDENRRERSKKKKKEKVKILFVLLNQKRRLRKGEKEHPSTLLKAYKNPKKTVRWLVTRRESVSLIFSTIRTGCTWRLVKGLTHDALPCRSVECGSSTAAATPLYVEDKGTLFFLPFFAFLFHFFLFSFSYSARGKPVLFHALTPKSSQGRGLTNNGLSTLSYRNIEC